MEEDNPLDLMTSSEVSSVKEEAAPDEALEAREGSKTPEMPVETPKEEPEAKLNPDLAEFEVPEHILKQIRKLPEVQEYVVDLHRTIRSFRNATAALQQLHSGGSSNTSKVFMPKKKKKVEPVLNTEDAQSWTVGMSIADQVKEVAESVVEETGFVYHESLGLYYDNQTGYYYDPSTKLYYDGVNKTYYTYDETSQLFSVYHQQEEKDPEEEKREHWEQELERKKRELLLEVRKNKSKKKKEEKKEVEEEGECSSDTDEDTYDYYKRKKPTKERVQPNHHKMPSMDEIDPCMRLIVHQTDIEKLRIGTLFIVTCTGGSLGREGSQHCVTIPDLNVSKTHCQFSYEEYGYWATDSGSTNGTWLNKKRLKKDKTRQVMHGSILRVANTFLLCHIHPGQETCGHCEPGLVQQQEAASVTEISTGGNHKEELLRLRRKFALSGVGEKEASLGSGYTDRADKRRATVGSQHHGEKTEAASVQAAVPQSNKGFKMLEKMGWKSGETLGKDGVSGISEPINIDLKNDKSGLGLDSIPMPGEMGIKDRRRKEAWDKARDRFLNIPEPPPET